MQRSLLLSLVAFLAAAVCFSSGCTLARPSADKLEAAAALADRPVEPHAPQDARADAGQATVVIRPERGRAEQHIVTAAEGMTVQSLLDQYKLARRFNNMQIKVMRVTPYSKGQIVPLAAEYDPVKNQIGVLHDMTILPGDQVVIVEDNVRRVDMLMGAMLGASRR